MRVLKVKLYQQFANYRKPASYSFIDTFPLPPPSTVKGWVHKVVGAEDYLPMAVSVQGTYETIVYDLQTLLKFNRKEREGVLLPWFGKKLTTSPSYVANLFNVDLIVHISAEDGVLRAFEERLFDTYPALGRWEDLVRIDDIRWVEVTPRAFELGEEYLIRRPLYLKKETAEQCGLAGINYRLPFRYEIIEGLRYFREKIDAVYVEEGSIYGSELLVDEEGDLVELLGDRL